MKEASDELVKMDKAAEALKISVRTLQRMMAAGTVPFRRFGVRNVRFRLSELNAHIDRNNRVCNDVGRRVRG